MKPYTDRPALGLVESIIVYAKDGSKKEIRARIDSGATKSSIHTELARELELGPSIGRKLVKSSNGQAIRPLIWVTVEVMGNKIKEKFTVADRSHLRYKMLIGQNILKMHGFFIDPNK